MGKRRIGVINELGRTCSRCLVYKLWDEFRRSGKCTPAMCLDCKKMEREQGPQSGRITLRNSHPKEYGPWQCMKTRCFNPNSTGFKYWGGRGVTVCKGLLKFETFISIVGSRPLGFTLDRIENDGHYSCGTCEQCISNGWILNVRWASWIVQASSRRPHGLGADPSSAALSQ